MGGATLPVGRTLVAMSRASCVACGRTSRRTHVATTVGSRIPARSVVASPTRPTLRDGLQGWFAATRRSACSKVWMQLQQTVQENKRGRQRRLHRTATCLLLFAAFASFFEELACIIIPSILA